MKQNNGRKTDAELLNLSETLRQQRLQEMEQLADVFARIFGSLTPGQRTDLMLSGETRRAA